MKFKNGKEMLKLIQNGTDLYNPGKETLVFLYGEKGSIAVYDWIGREKANELSKLSKENKDYWGSFLGPGGYIYEDGKEEEWCGLNFEGYWYKTDDYTPQLWLDDFLGRIVAEASMSDFEVAAELYENGVTLEELEEYYNGELPSCITDSAEYGKE